MLIRLELHIDSNSPDCATLNNKISVALLPVVWHTSGFVSCVAWRLHFRFCAHRRDAIIFCISFAEQYVYTRLRSDHVLEQGTEEMRRVGVKTYVNNPSSQFQHPSCLGSRGESTLTRHTTISNSKRKPIASGFWQFGGLRFLHCAADAYIKTLAVIGNIKTILIYTEEKNFAVKVKPLLLLHIWCENARISLSKAVHA